MSLITGNKVKKNHTSQGIVKKKRTKPTKAFLGSLSFDNNRVQISPRPCIMDFFPNFFIEYFCLQTSAKIIHR
jgi:hypothetical protein